MAGIVLLILVLALTYMDWNLFKHPLERIASANSGRTVKIDGPLQVHIWSLTPTITINGLTLGNPPWEAERPWPLSSDSRFTSSCCPC